MKTINKIVNQMMAMGKIFLLLSIFSLLFSVFNFSSAQELNASADRTTLSLGEQLQITFSFTGNGGRFKAPAFTDFDLLMGPMQSSNFSMMNGTTTQSISYTYILQPTKEGTFKIGPASIDLNGKSVQSNVLTITVAKGSGNTQNQNQNQNSGSADAATGAGKNVFVKASVDKSSVYRGEGLTVTYKIYTKVNLVNFQVSKLPAQNGFWSQDVAIQQPAQFHKEVLDGVQYSVAEIKKSVIFPQRSGTLKIEPMEADVIARIQAKRQRQPDPNNLFDQFFNDPFFQNSLQDVKYQLKSDPVTINVKELPETNVPASFKGAVGKFSMDASVDKNQTKTHEPVTFKLKLSGKGNIKLTDPPALNFPPDFETYDPKVSDNSVASAGGVSGSKTFEYLLIPRTAGDYKIPATEFSYFDLDKKQYEVLSTKEITIHVDRGKDDGSASVSGSVKKEDLQVLGKDIRYIKTNVPVFIKPGEIFFGSTLFYAVIILPAILFIILFIGRKKYAAMNSNVALMKSRKARGVAKKRLSIAKKYLEAKKRNEFLDEMFRALWGFVSDKLQIPVADLSKESASAALKEKNIDENLILKLSETIDNCEFARFAPGIASADEKIYEDGIDVITKLEEAIK